MYMEKTLQETFGHFFGHPYHSNCIKIYLDVALICYTKSNLTVSFSYFPKVALDHGECPQCVLEILWIMLQYSIQVLCNI